MTPAEQLLPPVRAIGFVKKLEGIPMTLHRMLEEQAKRAPLGSALVAPGRRPIGYLRLLHQCEQTVSQLNAAGIGRGDRLAVVLSNGPEMAVCFLALAVGAACAPLNPSYREAEFEFYLDDLRPRALIVQAGAKSPAIAVAQRLGIQIIRLHPALEDEAGVFRLELSVGVGAVAPTMAESGDEALILHTSGTTSRPKMVPLTAANLTASASNIAASLALTTADRCLNVMPLFHIHGLVGALLASLAAGEAWHALPALRRLVFWIGARNSSQPGIRPYPLFIRRYLPALSKIAAALPTSSFVSSGHARRRCLLISWQRWKLPSVCR